MRVADARQRHTDGADPGMARAQRHFYDEQHLHAPRLPFQGSVCLGNHEFLPGVSVRGRFGGRKPEKDDLVRIFADIKNFESPVKQGFRNGAGSGGRTRTVSLPLDFESSTSANSIIPADNSCIIQQGAKKRNSFFIYSFDFLPCSNASRAALRTMPPA